MFRSHEAIRPAETGRECERTMSPAQELNSTLLRPPKGAKLMKSAYSTNEIIQVTAIGVEERKRRSHGNCGRSPEKKSVTFQVHSSVDTHLSTVNTMVRQE